MTTSAARTAAGDAPDARAHGLYDAGGAHRLDEGVELVAGGGELDGERGLRIVNDVSVENVRQALDLVAHAAVGPDLDEQHLALDLPPFAHLHELDHVHELVQLLRDLFDNLVRAARHQRQA